MTEQKKPSQSQLLQQFVKNLVTATNSEADVLQKVYEAVGSGDTREEKIKSGSELYANWVKEESFVRAGYLSRLGMALHLNEDQKSGLLAAANELKRELRDFNNAPDRVIEIGAPVVDPNRRPPWRGR